MKIVKSVLILLFISFCSSCKVQLNDYYSGIIVDELGHPVESVSIKEYILDAYSNKPLDTFTDSNGFFKMNRSKVAISIPKIIISKAGFISDTIPIFLHQHEETTEYSTLIRTDSTKLVLRRKKN